MAISDGGESEAQEDAREPVDPIPFDFPRRNLRAGFNYLDGVSLPEIFARPASAVRVSMHEILDGKESGNVEREVRGWKLFFLLPRLVLFRPLRGGLVSKRKLQECVALFNSGDWAQLLHEGNSVAEAGAQVAVFF